MKRKSYPSDLTDAQFERIEPLIPVYPGRRPRTTNLRDVVFSILKTGCQWRYLPHDFPPKSTVWRYFDEWRHDGTLQLIHDVLSDELREKQKPDHPPTTASIDSQSVDASEGAEARGRDEAKNKNGCKRHILVDSLGLLLGLLVTGADIDDGAAALEWLDQVDEQRFEKIETVFGDNKYHNKALYAWIKQNRSYELVVIRRPKGVQGWVLLPIRWTVERTFAWLKRCRRLTVDREKTTTSSEAMIRLAMIRLMLRRLEPNNDQPEFRYRLAA